MARLALLLLLALVALPRSWALDCPEAGSGPTFDARGLAGMRGDALGLALPPGSRVRAPIDRALLCPDSPAGAPCLVQGAIELACTELGEGLDLEDVFIDGDLRLEGAHVRGDALRLAGVDVLGTLSLAGARIEGDLSLDRVSVAAELLAPLARVGGEARLTQLRALEGATLSGASIRRTLEIERSVFGSLDLSSSEAAALRMARSGVVEELWLERVRVAGPLELELLGVGSTLFASGLEVGGALVSKGTRLDASAELGGRVEQGVSLQGLQVRGDLELLSLECGGAFELVSSRVGAHLAADESVFESAFRVEYGEIGKDGDLLGATIHEELAFVGVRFGGRLYVNEEELETPLRLTDCVPPDPRPR